MYDVDTPKYQLLAFVVNPENDNTSNTMYYGISITVQEIIDVSSGNRDIVSFVRYLRVQNAALEELCGYETKSQT